MTTGISSNYNYGNYGTMSPTTSLSNTTNPSPTDSSISNAYNLSSDTYQPAQQSSESGGKTLTFAAVAAAVLAIGAAVITKGKMPETPLLSKEFLKGMKTNINPLKWEWKTILSKADPRNWFKNKTQPTLKGMDNTGATAAADNIAETAKITGTKTFTDKYGTEITTFNDGSFKIQRGDVSKTYSKSE